MFAMEEIAKNRAKLALCLLLAFLVGILIIVAVSHLANHEDKEDPPQILNEETLNSFFEQLVDSSVSLSKDFTWNLQYNSTRFPTLDSPEHLFGYVNVDLNKMDTVNAMLKLASNLEPDLNVAETVDEMLVDNFLDAVMDTDVMKAAFQFLLKHQIVENDESLFRKKVKEMWFTLYNRNPEGPKGSSGFEHVFIGEFGAKNVIGLHNWIQFAAQERSLIREDAPLNYWGYREYTKSKFAYWLYCEFLWHDRPKIPGSSFWVGTTPEFELAVYTVCFLVKEEMDCSITIDNQRFDIVTHWFLDQKGVIGTAFPVLSLDN